MATVRPTRLPFKMDAPIHYTGNGSMPSAISIPVQNGTGGDVSNGTCRDPIPRDEELAKVEIGVQAVIFILALGGNATVLFVLALRKKKLSRMHMFIMHLSLADLFVAFFNVLPQMAWDVTYRFKGGDFLCRFVKYTSVVAMYASSYVLVATALDRYTAIVYPLTTHTWSQRRIALMVGTAWALSLMFSIPQPIMFTFQDVSQDKNCPVYDCWMDETDPRFPQIYVTVFLTLVYFVPLLILIFCYGRICCIVWHSMSARESPSPSSKPNTPHILGKEASKGLTMQYEEKLLRKTDNSAPRAHVRGISNAKMKTIKLTLAVIICYQVCWSPFFISQMYWAWHPNASMDTHVWTIILLLPSLNSMTNPWIYLMFNDNICQQVKTRYRPNPSYYSEYRTSSTRLGASVIQSETTAVPNECRPATNSIQMRPVGNSKSVRPVSDNCDMYVKLLNSNVDENVQKASEV